MSVVRLALACQPDTHTPDQRDSLWQAVMGALIASASVPAAQVGTSSRGTDHPGGKRPPGEGETGDAGWWQHEYVRFEPHWAKCEVVRRAGEFLESLSVRPGLLRTASGGVTDGRVQETMADLHARIIRDGEGWSVREVAVSMRCTEREVRRARRAAFVAVESGLAVVPVDGSRVGRVRAMREAGMTVTQIAALVGVDKATVSRDLRRQAA